jgi:hypothetical protein
MIVLPATIRYALRANDIYRRSAVRLDKPEPDPAPVVKFFNPLGPQVWLATELAADGDALHGLADLGFGCPEMGPWSLREISELRLPFGVRIEIDTAFKTAVPLSVWAACAKQTGSIPAAEIIFGRSPRDRSETDRG